MKVKTKKPAKKEHLVAADVKRSNKNKVVSGPLVKKPKITKSEVTGANSDSVKKLKTKKVKSTTANVAKDHKASLDKLKNIDPEFYKFLEQNDKKLLKFNADVDDNDDDDDEDNDLDEDDVKNRSDDDDEDDDDNNDDGVNKKTHKPSKKMDVASDESDFEDEDNTVRKDNSITLKLLKEWQTDLSKDKVPIDVIKNVVLALNSTLLTLAGETNASSQAYKVEGAAAFNGVIQLCVLHLEPAVRRFLGLHERTALKPHKCKKWNKIKSSLRGYILDVTKLLEQVSSANILTVLLKHLHQIVPMISSFSSLAKPILKRLVSLWSTGEETVRVLSFLCILRITRDQQTTVLSTVLKAMYLSYVRNSKFVSPGTLPAINFMRRSLTELFTLDLSVSYQHVFLYIRQLAIHLRNAMTLRKKDSYQAVYNWQFINSIRLWAELLSATNDKAQLQPLIFPLVSIITGTIKLIPTAQFFPLRFHCIQTLVQLSKQTRTFIPVLPFILEVLNSNTFGSKHSKTSMKPLQFTCILRLNKNQLLEIGFRDEVVENIISSVLDYMAHESYTISYPDLAVSAIIQLKHYVKNGKNLNSNHTRKLKQLYEKLEENSRFVDAERTKFNFELKDTAAVSAWESKLRNKGTPLLTYYENWVKTHVIAQKRHTIQSENIDEYNLPKLLKRKLEKKEKSNGPAELFPSDEEDDELEFEQVPKTKKAKNQKIVENLDDGEDAANKDDDKDSFTDDGVDIVKDLDLDDW